MCDLKNTRDEVEIVPGLRIYWANKRAFSFQKEIQINTAIVADPAFRQDGYCHSSVNIEGKDGDWEDDAELGVWQSEGIEATFCVMAWEVSIYANREKCIDAKIKHISLQIEHHQAEIDVYTKWVENLELRKLTGE